MQKVVTLNTCCDIACLTFQLPHVTSGYCQSHRRQPTTGSIWSFQRLKEQHRPFSQMKKFCNHKLVWRHFQVGWASGLQFVYFLDNINNQKYVWIILLKMTFWISQGKIATSDRWGGQTCKIFMSNFFQDFTCQKSLNRLIFDSYSKNKRWTFLGHGVYSTFWAKQRNLHQTNEFPISQGTAVTFFSCGEQVQNR